MESTAAAQTDLIFHIIARDSFEKLDGQDTLVPSSEGFIHCTKEESELLNVANRHYKSIPGEFIVLEIDERHVKPEIKYEQVDGHAYPHVYGPLNLEAVICFRSLVRGADGTFTGFGQEAL